MSMKTRPPRSRHTHFRFGSKSLIMKRKLNETSQFFCVSLVWICWFSSRFYFPRFQSHFVAKGRRSAAVPSQFLASIITQCTFYLTILNSESHLLSNNYLILPKIMASFQGNIHLHLQYARYKQGIIYWNLLEPMQSFFFELIHCFFEHASRHFTSKNSLLLLNKCYTMLITCSSI